MSKDKEDPQVVFHKIHMTLKGDAKEQAKKKVIFEKRLNRQLTSDTAFDPSQDIEDTSTPIKVLLKKEEIPLGDN